MGLVIRRKLMPEKSGNGQKNDYRALIRYLSWALALMIICIFGFVVQAQVKLDDKVDKKVDKKEYRQDIKEIKTEQKDFRKEVREDMKEIKALIREARK